jgi:hypothetical protein
MRRARAAAALPDQSPARGRSSDQLARRGVARGKQAGDVGLARLVGDAQPTDAAHGSFTVQCHFEALRVRIDALASERHRQRRLNVWHGFLQITRRSSERRVDGASKQRPGEHARVIRAASGRERLAVRVEEVCERERRRARLRGPGRGDRVIVRELHAGQLGARFDAHQVAVAGVRVATQQAGTKCAAASRQNYRSRPD